MNVFWVFFDFYGVWIGYVFRYGFVDFGYGFVEFNLVVEYGVDGIEVFFRFIVKFFGFCFEFLKVMFGIDVNGIFCVFINVEF